MAHKKVRAARRNGRDSNSQQRPASRCTAASGSTPGSVHQVRQVGSTIHAGTNVGVGKDFTLFALVDGVVKYEWRTRTQRKVSVYPRSSA